MPATQSSGDLVFMPYGEAASALLATGRELVELEEERLTALGPSVRELASRMERAGVFAPLRSLGQAGWAVDGGMALDRRTGNSLALVAVSAIPREGKPLGGGRAFLIPHTVGAERVVRALMAMEELIAAVSLVRRDEGWVLLDGSVRSGLVSVLQGLNSLSEEDGARLREILEPRIGLWVDVISHLYRERPPLAAVPKLTSGFGLASRSGFNFPLSDRAFLSLVMPPGTWTSLERLMAFLGQALPQDAGGERWTFPAGLGLPETLGGYLGGISRAQETGWVRPGAPGSMAVQVETSGNLEEALDSLTGQFPTSRLREPLLLVEADRAAKGLCRLIGRAGAGEVPWAVSYRTSF